MNQDGFSFSVSACLARADGQNSTPLYAPCLHAGPSANGIPGRCSSSCPDRLAKQNQTVFIWSSWPELERERSVTYAMLFFIIIIIIINLTVSLARCSSFDHVW
ncbi:hypothetical protein EYF80_051288 [Liparis tanakae]|uniref:Uncharacterized protein n=1 Tax=Liparis tanakae TaxID=230148 RepID=A0A4Z2FC87_9TELE|nr:hypothetical protein EYF80_051288 [Liparis tanakae]